ncbi:MAG: cation diffusion facilitator family transporter [Gordonia sp. (in: high G+C Gram-positive bacteria)]|uniref:cation diffusion facilitator family transporter n=1 Tax=Gordonia sp. (in: high G+C Gram-positive bacteria) TaxID=84139 RepID=UPI003BB5DE13
MRKVSDVRVVATSTLVSAFDVTLNLIVALATGSTVMLSQALQGTSDLATGGLLFVGVRRSQRKADHRFPFGYGREIYFWALIASMIMFAGTGAASLYFGYRQVVDPSPVEHLWLAFAMLLFGALTNGYALSLSIHRMRQDDDASTVPWWRHLWRSSLIETKATLTIDLLGTSAAVLGLAALGTYWATGLTQFDGVGSLAIGVAMMAGAALLMRDLRDLIVGRGVDANTRARLGGAALSVPGVQSVLDLLTMYVGSSKLFVVLELHLTDGLTTDDIELITDEVKDQVRDAVPLVHHIQVEIETPVDEVLPPRHALRRRKR